MASTFQARTDELLKQIGSGKLRGEVIIDQVYAKYHHESPDLSHKRGKWKYLHDPLFSDYPEVMKKLANKTLHGDLVQAMAGGMEDVADAASHQAPFELGDLANSTHVRVKDGGSIAYNHPPTEHRLSKAELYAKYKRRPKRRR